MAPPSVPREEAIYSSTEYRMRRLGRKKESGSVDGNAREERGQRLQYKREGLCRTSGVAHQTLDMLVTAALRRGEERDEEREGWR